MKMNKTREMLSKIFVKALEEDRLPWQRGWKIAHNAISKKEYRGVNKVLLSMVAVDKGYKDPRWVTFNQAREKGWKVKKGSKGVPIEYWSIYDKRNKRNIDFNKYHTIIKQDSERKKDMKLVAKTYFIFNAENLDGIEQYISEKNIEKTNQFKLAITVAKNYLNTSGITLKHGGHRAYYNENEDYIRLPELNDFMESDAYARTLIHECAHSTGHKSRLNREGSNSFGSINYAKEELMAEIASAFLCGDFDLPLDQKHIENHKAYIQDWGKLIKEDPEELFKAIKSANDIADYFLEIGEYEKELAIFEKEDKGDNEKVITEDSIEIEL